MILELEEQFKLVITSVIFAMIVTNLYTFIEIVFSKLKVLFFIFVLLPNCFFSSVLLFIKGF